MTRRPRMLGAGALVALATLAFGPETLLGQYDEPPPPAAYALRNVTLVASDGSRTEGLTLVVRDGLVETLAAGVEPPADALVLEGDSLLVYPGFVDAQASVDFEFPEPKDVQDEDDITGWDPPRSASGFTPHRRVAHHLTALGEDVADQREKGIVAGLVHPTDGMAAGHSAALVFRADARVPTELVSDDATGLAMAFEQAGGVYPSQLFGVIAYLRQAFMDAELYATGRTAYEMDPSGMTAPPWDPDFEALGAAARGELPVHFEADSDEDIRRVLNLADELGFLPVIVGGGEAWKMADELARRNVPVLVSVDFPEPDEWDPEADTLESELEPEAAREKERIENAWANAGRLEAAGVTFALTSGGGSADLLEGARKAVDYGLSEAAALGALTATPAAMIGLPALGRVAVDGGATFAVLDGDLFGEESGVVYTFVEGRLEEGRALGGESADGDAPASDVSGEWEGSVGAQGMNIGFTMTLTMEEDGSLSGTLIAEGQGEAPVTGSVSGDEVRLVIDAEGMPEPITLTGTLSADGQRVEGGGSTAMGDMDFTATKLPGGGAGWADLFRSSGTSRTSRAAGSGGGR